MQDTLLGALETKAKYEQAGQLHVGTCSYATSYTGFGIFSLTESLQWVIQKEQSWKIHRILSQMHGSRQWVRTMTAFKKH